MTPDAGRIRAIAFLNWAHALDHFVLLIYPTVVIGLEVVYGRPYSELIAASTAAFVAFGVFALPAGWLADRWSRRNMMAVFYLGCGASLVAVALAPNLVVLTVALFALGTCAAIYHPVGMAMLIELSQARGRSLAFNGVCGNLGAALASFIAAILASWFGWRAAFLVPAVVCLVTGAAFVALVPDDRHRIGARKTVADVVFSPRIAIAIFGLYIVISLCGGLTFNTVSVALPKMVDERLGGDLPQFATTLQSTLGQWLGADVRLTVIGGLVTLVFLCGAVAQITVGRLVERFPGYILFAGVCALQFLGILWATNASGAAVIPALAVTMSAIYGQVTLGDIVVARYTADAWRGRIYSVRYFLTFVSSGAAVSAIAFLYGSGGFDLVLTCITAVAGVLLAAVLGFVVLVAGVEGRRASVQPAE